MSMQDRVTARRMRAWARKKLRGHAAKPAAPVAKPQFMEALEPRVLLSAAPDWAVHLPEDASQQFPGAFVNDVAIADDVFASGSFNGNIEFDPNGAGSEQTGTSQFGSGFIASYDLADGSLNWAQVLNPSSSSASIRELAAGTTGNVYFAGNFNGSVDFGEGVVSNNGQDFFVGEYDDTGTLQWVETFGGSGGDRVQGLTLASNGDLLLTIEAGNSSFDVDVSGDTQTFPADNWGVLRLSGTGDYVDHLALSETQGRGIFGLSQVAEASDGDIIITGTVRNDTLNDLTFELSDDQGGQISSFLLDSDDDVSTIAEDPTILFVGRINSSLDTFDWLNEWDTNAAAAFGPVAVDSDDQIFLPAQIGGDFDFDPTGGEQLFSPSGGFTVPGIVSVASDGSFIFGHGIDAEEGEGRAVTILEDQGNTTVILGGYFAGTNVDFDPGAGTALGSSSQGDAFFSFYNEDGTYQETIILGSANHDDILTLASDGSSRLVVGGNFDGPIDLDPQAGSSLNITDSPAAFVAVYQDVAGDGVSGGGSVDTGRAGDTNLTGAFTFGQGIISTDPGEPVDIGIEIFNEGPDTVNGGIFVDLYASEDGTLGTGDIYLGRFRLPNQAIAAESSQTIDLQATFPLSVSGNLTLVGIVDPQDRIGETNNFDNQFVSSNTVEVTTPAYDLTGTVDLDRTRLPEALVTGEGDRGFMRVEVTNTGTTEIPQGAVVTVRVFADPGGEGQLINVTQRDGFARVGGLGQGESTFANVRVQIADDQLTSDGDYTFVAVIDPDEALAEANEGNNQTINGPVVTVSQANIDLEPVIADVRIDEDPISGERVRGTVLVEITNTGNVPTDPRETIDITLTASPDGEGQDTVLTYDDQRLGRINPGQTRRVVLRIDEASGFPAGAGYDLTVNIDTSDNIDEDADGGDGEGNNQDSVVDVFTSVEGEIDLEPTILDSGLPSAVIAGEEIRGRAVIELTNNGNLPVPRDGTVNIELTADPGGEGQVIVLASQQNVRIGNLRPEQSRRMVIPYTASFPAGADYDFVVNITSVSEDTSADNNEVTQQDVLDSADPFVNLNIDIDEDRLRLPASIISGQQERVVVPVEVTNNGNVALDRDDTVDITLFASQQEGQDVELITIQDQRVGNLQPGQSRRFNVVFTLNDEVVIPDGTYNLRAEVDTGEDVDESGTPGGDGETDNTDTTNAQIIIAPGFDDIDVDLEQIRVDEQIVAGDGDRILVGFSLTNDGNRDLEDGQVTVEISLEPDGGEGESQLLTTVEIDLGRILRSGQSRTFREIVEVPAGTTPNDYNFEVAIVDDNFTDANAGNDVAVSAESVNVQPGFVDFDAAIGDRFRQPDGTIITGDNERLLVPVEITNDGTVNIARGQRVNVSIYAVEDGGSGLEHLLAQEEVNVSNLRPEQTRTANILTEFEQGSLLNDGQYILRAVVDDVNEGSSPETGDVDESDESNNSADTAAFDVELGTVDLTVSLRRELLPDDAISGDGDRLRLLAEIQNEGTVPTNRDATIDVQVYAVPSEGQNTLIHTEEGVNVRNLRPEQRRVTNITFELPPGLDTETYTFLLMIDTSDDIIEDNEGGTAEDNNQVATEGSVVVTEGEVDIVTTITDSTLPSGLVAGEGGNYRVTVELTNDGNVDLPRDTRVDLTVSLRPSDAQDDSQDIEIGALTDQPAFLRDQQSRIYRVDVAVSVEVPQDEYVLVVKATPTEALEEAETENNIAVSADVITVDEGSNDLEVNSATHNFSGAQETGDTGVVTVRLANRGTVTAQGDVDIEIFATPGGIIDENAVLIGSVEGQSVNLDNDEVTGNINVPVTIEGALDSGDYTLVARVTPVAEGGIVDDNDANDVIAIAPDVTVEGAVQAESLEFVLDEITLGTSVTAGETVIAGGVTMTISSVVATNGGNNAAVDDFGILFGSDAGSNDAESIGISFDVDVVITDYIIGSREDVPAGTFFTITGTDGASGQNEVPEFDGFTESEVTLPYVPGQLTVLKAGETYTISHNMEAGLDPLFNLEALMVTPVIEEHTGAGLFGTVTFTQTGTPQDLGAFISSQGDATSTVAGIGSYDTLWQQGSPNTLRLGLGIDDTETVNASHLNLQFPSNTPTLLGGRQITFQETSTGATGTYTITTGGQVLVDGSPIGDLSGWFVLV